MNLETLGTGTRLRVDGRTWEVKAVEDREVMSGLKITVVGLVDGQEAATLTQTDDGYAMHVDRVDGTQDSFTVASVERV